MELEQVRTRVAPAALAHERTLPVLPELTDLFPENGLVRGRVLSCTGPAATSLALAVSAAAMEAGSWMAVVDVPTLGLDAAVELGVPLHRMVRVASGDWASTVAAALDGFDLVVTTVPRGLRRAATTMLSSRIRQRGAVVIALGTTGDLACDGILRTEEPVWEGLGVGHGRLYRRHVAERSGGRRAPVERGVRCSLPGVRGRLQAGESGPGELRCDESQVARLTLVS